MRNQNDITLEWRETFKGGDINKKTLDRAQKLVDELSVESPLRVRLEKELNELREIGKNAK